MRQLIFLSLLLGLIEFAGAQTISVSGWVIDTVNNTPLTGAAVQELNKTSNGTITDSNGYFKLSVSSSVVRISYIGYETREIRVNAASTNVFFRLKESGDMLNQIVVIADRNEKRLKELTTSVETLRPDIVNDKNPVVIDEVVNQIPGVSITEGQVNIRAGSGWSYGAGSRVTVFIDGAPLLNGDAGSVLWNFVSTDNIGNIEVLKGASSVLYGSSALNGIININTLWSTDKPKTSFTAFSGLYGNPAEPGWKWTNTTRNVQGIRMGDSRSFKKLQLNSNIEAVQDEGYRFGDFEKRLHLGLDARYRLTKDMYLGLRTHLLKTDVGSFLLWKSYDSAYNALDDAFTTTNGTKLRIDPFWTFRTKGNWFYKINSRYLYVDNQVDSGDPDKDQSNSASTVYNDVQITTPRLFGLQFTGGALYSFVKSNSPLFSGEQHASNTAGYVQGEWKYRKLIVNAGGRFEHYELNDYKESKPVFRGGINYQISKATFIRASYGQGYRFPTIAESFISTKVGIVSVFPNENLRSESGNNTEIGLKQGFRFKSLKGFLDVAAFRMYYNNMMEFTFSQWSKDNSFENGLGLGFKSLNTGKTEISGLDISLNGEYEIAKNKSIRFLCGYTYSNPVSLEPNKQFATDSFNRVISYLSTSSDNSGNTLKYRNKALLKIDVSINLNKWQGGFSVRYNSYMSNIDNNFVTPPLSIFIPGIQQGQDLNSHGTWITDIRIFYEFPKNYRVGIVGSNIFGTAYMIRPGDMGPPSKWLLQVRKEINY